MKKSLMILFLMFGILVGLTTLISAACTDSDGGNNQYLLGTVSSTGSPNTPDTCISSNTLNEATCNSGALEVGLTTCINPATCSNGACGVSSCTDSDNGKIYSTKGEVNVNGDLFEQDYCAGGFLYETYCDPQSIPRIEKKSCGECNNGVCISGVSLDRTGATSIAGTADRTLAGTDGTSTTTKTSTARKSSGATDYRGWTEVPAADGGVCYVKTQKVRTTGGFLWRLYN